MRVPTHRADENNGSQLRSLQFKMKNTFSDFVKGTYIYKTKENKPETGHPWVQIQQVTIHNIPGWVAVDAFDSIGNTFVPLTPRDALSAVLNYRGIFATAAPIAASELFPKFVTHHITDKISLERLTRDLKEMFDLTVVLQWKDGVPETDVLPNCRVDSYIQEKIEQEYEFVVRKVGTEMDFRKAAKFGVDMNDGNLYSLGVFTKPDIDIIEENLKNSICAFLTHLFDSGIRWGEESEEVATNIMEQFMEGHAALV